MQHRRLLTVATFLTFVCTNGKAEGPLQTEFTSFEPVGAASDMVSCVTGDFSFVLPLGEVRGTGEVGYPIVLNYHAGIKNNQESSWTGLGWGLNVGALTRRMRGVPDDYEGGGTVSYAYDDGDDGWSVDVGGGWGPISATVGWSYTTTEGHQWDGLTSFGMGAKLGPFYAGLSSNLRLDVLTFSTGISIGNMSGGIGVTIHDEGVTVGLGASFGGSLASVRAGFTISDNDVEANVGMSVTGARMGGGTHSDAGVFAYYSGLGATLPLPFGIRLDFNYAEYGWHFAQMLYGQMYGYLASSPGNGMPGTASNNVLVNPGGLGKAVVDRVDPQGAAGSTLRSSRVAGVNIEEQYDKVEYLRNGDYHFSAADLFSVTGQGIGGTFRAYPYNSTRTCASAESEYQGIVGKPTAGSGTRSDPYTYDYFNTNPATVSDDYTEGWAFRMLGERALNLIDYPGVSYSRDEIIGNLDQQLGNVYGTRIEPIYGGDAEMPTRITGFVVTAQDGKSYYYTQPLYTLHQISYVNSQAQAPTSSGSRDFSFDTDHSYHALLEPYVTTWLLTAITGPDYVKLGAESGSGSLPGDGDLGYWVRFRYEYGNLVVDNPVGTAEEPLVEEARTWGDASIRRTSLRWRMPFYDSETPSTHREDPYHANRYASVFGVKELTYLKAIETSAEIAYFRTSPRLDGYGVDDASYPTFQHDLLPDATFTGYRSTPVVSDDVPCKACTNSSCTWHSARYWVQPFPYYVQGPKATELTRCPKLTVPNSVLSPEGFAELPQGTLLASVVFSGKLVYEHDLNDNRLTRQCQWRLKIVKDTYECEGDYISPDMAAERVYSDDAYEDGGHTYALHTSNAKCFHAETDPADPSKTILYMTPFESDLTQYGYWYHQPGQTTYTVLTGNTPEEADHTYWTLSTIENFQVHSIWAGSSLERYKERNPVCRYKKKLHEIAWYSKSRYPGIKVDLDPGSEYVQEIPQGLRPSAYQDDEDYPKSYKRVKLSYGYDCAPGTPNSKAMNGGRLTLRKVTFEGGAEEAPTVLPGYVFTYQNADRPYEGWDNMDPWGHPAGDELTTQDDGQSGVCWNLSRIGLPNGGSIAVEYERDRLENSPLASIYRMRRERRADFPHQLHGDMDYFHPRLNIEAVETDGRTVTFNNSHTSHITRGDLIMFAAAKPYVPSQRDCDLALTAVWKRQGLSDVGMYKILSIAPLGGYRKKVVLDASIPSDILDRGLIEAYILKRDDMFCDGLRVTDLTLRPGCGDTRNSVSKHFEYSDPALRLLPNDALPRMMAKTGGAAVQVCNNLFVQNGWRLANAPYSTDLSKNYNIGNTQVLYGEVETRSVDPSGGRVAAGSVRRSFWTCNDRWQSGEGVVDLIEDRELPQGTQEPRVRQIWDRSSIEGMPKLIEYLDVDGKSVYVKEYKYAYGHELNQSSNVKVGSFDQNQFVMSRPLGLVNERSLTVDINGNVATVADVITSIPYLVGMSERTLGVELNTDFGWFNARTGSPLVTLVRKGDGQGRLDLIAPYTFIADDETKQKLGVKNAHAWAGGHLTREVSVRNDAKPSDFTYEELVDKWALAGASRSEYAKQQFDPVAGSSARQWRYYLAENYSWLDGAGSELQRKDFTWAIDETEAWRLRSAAEIDQYTRTTTMNNAENVRATRMNHPRLNVVCALIRGASYRECGAYTCDYDVSRGKWLDDVNGWERGQGKTDDGQIPPGVPAVVVTTEAKHFGDKGLKVTNAWGPSRNFKLVRGRNYELSAWMRVAEGSNSVPFARHVVMNADYRKRLNTTENEDFPIEVEPWTADNPGLTCSGVVSVTEETDGWKRVVMTIPAKDDISQEQWENGYQYVRVWVGCPSGNGNGADATVYVDDIRFVPSDGLAVTTYYDQEVGLPKAVVDENSNVRKYSYDGLGRKTAEYNTAGKKVRKYEYWSACEGGLTDVRVLYPNDVTYIATYEPTLVKWAAPCADRERVLLTVNGQLIEGCPSDGVLAAQGRFEWEPQAEVANARLRIQVVGTNIHDESDAAFSIERD